jgi:hypothetical protein
MEMPKACWSCDLRFVCKAANDFLTTKEAGCSVLKVGMEGCLIVCQLPEGHGRLVDADALYKKRYIVEPGDILASITVVDACYISGAHTIVPAERSEL